MGKMIYYLAENTRIAVIVGIVLIGSAFTMVHTISEKAVHFAEERLEVFEELKHVF